MRQYLLAIATAIIVALGFNVERANAAPIGAAGAMHAVTGTINQAEPVQYVGGRCWRNAGWHGAGWYPCVAPGVVYGPGAWHWHNRYAWHNSWHSNWHNHYSYHNNWHSNRHASGRRNFRHAHASAHRGGRHGGGHHGGHHGGGHHGGHRR